MGFISAFVRLTRFEHAIMLAIAVFISETIVLNSLPVFSFAILLSLLVPILSEMGAFALNDYFDVETDRINKRKDRPLVSGELSKEFAFYFSLISILGSIVFSYLINFYAFLIAFTFNILAIAYNYKLKDLPLVGNIYIGLSMAVPFLFGSVVILNSLSFSPTVLSISAIALLAGVAREIVKSVEDMKGDKEARRSWTLPIVVGEKNARSIASVLYLIFVPLSFMPFYYGLKQLPISLALVSIADLLILYIAYSILVDNTARTFRRARNLSLFSLSIGLIGLLLAAVL